MSNTCSCAPALPPRLLRGVTRTVKIAVVDKNEEPVDLTVAREVSVLVSLDGAGRNDWYVPGITITGDDSNVVQFSWYADVQHRCGRYTIEVKADFGNRNQSRVDFHRQFGVELVEHSCDVTVVTEDAMEIDDEVDLEGTLEVTTDGMTAFDQWRTSPESEGYPPTEEGFFDWIRQPATDAATAAATQMGVIQGRADEDHRIAAADHTLAGTDHGTAVSDHTRAGEDHTQAGNDHTQAASDHTIAGQDHTQAGQDHTRAGNDHTTAAADHTIAGQDHTQAGNDHTRAEGDHTQAGNDHTRAESDHTRAEQDHTRAEQDHASVGEAVKYTQQTLTDEQKAQARTNIGAGTYSKPANGIPESDLATAVQNKLNGWQIHDLGEIDLSDYDDDVATYVTTALLNDGDYRFEANGSTYYVHVEVCGTATDKTVQQVLWGTEEGGTAVSYFSVTVEDGEVTDVNTTSLLDFNTASSTFAYKVHNHFTTADAAQSVWDYCNSNAISSNNNGIILYRDTLNSKSWLIEYYAQASAPVGRYQKVQAFDDASVYYQRTASKVGNNWVWSSWEIFTSQPAAFSGTSSTSASTAAKTVSCDNFSSDTLVKGAIVVVTFSNTNAAATGGLKLNVSSTGAKPIKRFIAGGVADIDKPGSLAGTMPFVYDGTNWVTWYESFDNDDGQNLNAKFGNVSLKEWKPDYTMTDGYYVKGADGLLYEYSGSKYVEVEVTGAERVRFLGIYPKYSSWTNGFAFGKYVNDQWVTIESEKFDYDTSQEVSLTMEYIRAVPSGATHFRTSSASSSLLALEREFYLYLQTGKPAVSQEELEDAVNPPIGTTQPNGGFLPNKVYDLGTLTGTVTFALAAPTDNTRPNPYHWTFETGATAPTINWPSGLTWLGGAPPDPEASKHYEIMVRNGYASALVFDLPTS